MPISKIILDLFLSLFRCCLIFLSKKYPAFIEIYLLMLQNQSSRRYFEQNGIKPPFELWEKQAVHECFKLFDKAKNFFTLVSPNTVLYAWKNAVAKHWSIKQKHKPGRPRVSQKLKEPGNR